MVQSRYCKYLWYAAVLTPLIIFFCLIRQTDIKYKQLFIERNPDLSLPKINTQISGTVLWLLSSLIPIGGILFNWLCCSNFLQASSKAGPFHLQNTTKKYEYLAIMLYGLIITLLTTSAFTNAMKILFGEPRPNFFATCNYQNYYDAMITNNYTAYETLTVEGRFGNIIHCNASNSDINDAFASFPSGHASLIFASMTFFGSVMTMFNQGNIIIKLIQVISFYGAYVLATWISITRVLDYEHRSYDVLAGALFGIFVGYFVMAHIKKEAIILFAEGNLPV